MDSSTDSIAMQKRSLRQSLLAQRRSLSTTEWRETSDRLCQQLINDEQFQRATTVLTYSSFRQEPDVMGLMQIAVEKRWGLSRCVDQMLVWHEWSPGMGLQPNRYGILEPDQTSPQIDARAVDLILVPAIACDFRGYRLGYGGGFYDRLLSQSEWAEKRTVGIVFEHLRLPELPIEPWDCPMAGVCTETGLFWR
jgi:5-formyltetrahydrofolate cyclo-ligase